MKSRRIHQAFFTGFALLILFVSGCGTISLTSKWRNQDILIDGVDTEWRGSRYLIDKQYLTIGVMNDENFVYLRISTPERMKQIKMLRAGVIVWFDDRGKCDKTVGIRYPLPASDSTSLPDRNSPPELSAESGNANVNEKTPEIPRFPDNIAIITGKTDMEKLMTFAEATEQGIEVKIGSTGRDIVYEMKVPFSVIRTSGVSQSSKKTSDIAIGIELPRIETRRQTNTDRNRYGQNRNRDINMMGAGQRIDPLADAYELWMKVSLADKH